MTFHSFVRDVKHSVRALRRSPGFTAIAVLTLAAAIGANTVIFSLVNGVLLQPLPYQASDRIGIIWHDLGNGAQSLPALNAADFYDYRERSEVFEAFTIATGRERILGGATDPQLVDVGMVAFDFFSFFGIEPALGRNIRSEEDIPSGPTVAVLSHGLWSARFGADPDVIGQSVILNDRSTEIIGVLPEDFQLLLPEEAFLLRDADIWIPVGIDRAGLPPRNFTGFTVFGRIRAGTTWAQAQDDMDRMEAQLKAEHSVHAASNLQVRVVPLHRDVVKQARTGLNVLFAAVGFVLLIACANVAILLLARSHTRRRELAIRQALGAGRGGLRRLILVESLLLSLSGGVLGLLFARLGMSVVLQLAGSSVPRLHTVGVNGSVFLFLIVLVSLTAAIFGLFPAMQGGRMPPSALLNEGQRGGDRSGGSARRVLVVGEITLSVVLLVGAVLMVRSFAALQQIQPGFETANRLTFRLSLPSAEFREASSRRAFWNVLSERLEGIPGVAAVAATSQLPLTGSGTLQPFAFNEETAQNWESVTADERGATPGYLSTMGATLLAGREFTDADFDNDAPRIIIDETLAAMAFPDGDVVGNRLQIGRDGEPDDFAEVIGVVAHIHLHDVTRAVLPQLYYPLLPGGRFAVVVETTGVVDGLFDQIRAEVRAVSTGIPIEDVQYMDTLLAAALAQARLSLSLMTAFGFMALLLSAGGLYGVISYTVRQRTREIGIRLALGQTPGSVRADVFRNSVYLVVPSVALGLLTAAVLGHLMSNMLFGVSPVDVLSYGAVALLLGGTAVLASWVPARRATKVDPITALRAE